MKRIRLYAVLTVLVIMLMMLALSFMVCRYAMNTENHVRYTGIMNVAAEKIAKTINGMEMNAINVFDEVEKNMFSPEDVIAALYSKANLNPNVNGYFAAFEPDHFPQKGRWFEPYVHKSDKGNKYVMSQVGSARHDYTKSDWYVRAKDVGVSFWSDPYYYYDGTSISGHYCTFVEPIFDAEKNLLCVCGADMTLEWLAKELKQIDMASKQNDKTSSFLMDQKRDFYTVVLNSDGSCLASPEGKSLSLKYEQALEDLKERRSGMLETSVNGEAVTVYYCPIQNIDWVVAVPGRPDPTRPGGAGDDCGLDGEDESVYHTDRDGDDAGDDDRDNPSLPLCDEGSEGDTLYRRDACGIGADQQGPQRLGDERQERLR